jgi:hypothetical protein
VEGFLSALPQHTDVALVGIADADPALFAKYQKKYSLADTLFYKQRSQHDREDSSAGRAGLHIDRRASGMRLRLPRTVWRVGDGGEAADYLACGCAGDSRIRRATTKFTCW